jgi:hypothetical protein
VANRFAAITMVRESQIAIGTGNDVTARRALDRGSEPATIQQQNGLPIFGQRLFNRIEEWLGYAASIDIDPIGTQVDRGYLRQWSV